MYIFICLKPCSVQHVSAKRNSFAITLRYFDTLTGLFAKSKLTSSDVLSYARSKTLTSFSFSVQSSFIENLENLSFSS